MGARLARTTAVAAIAVPLALAAACGSSGGTDTAAGTGQSTSPTSPSATSPTNAPSSPGSASPSGRPAPAGWASCAEIWKDGAKLPAHYKGCAAAGSATPAQQVACESGQFIVLYGEHYWGVRGGVIKHSDRKLANSRAYSSDIATCRG